MKGQTYIKTPNGQEWKFEKVLTEAKVYKHLKRHGHRKASIKWSVLVKDVGWFDKTEEME